MDPASNRKIVEPREWILMCIERAIETDDSTRQRLNSGHSFHDVATSWANENGTAGLEVFQTIDLETGRKVNNFMLTDRLVLNARQFRLCHRVGFEIQDDGYRTADGRGVALLQPLMPSRNLSTSRDVALARQDREPQRAVNADDPPYTFSDDCRTVKWYGESYTFTPTQADVVNVLRQAMENGLPGLSEGNIADRLGRDVDKTKLWQIFRNKTYRKGKLINNPHPAKDKMIKKIGTRTYTLAPPE